MTETTASPYQPPKSATEIAVADHGVELSIFTPRGRIGRLRFLVYLAGASLVPALIMLVLQAFSFGAMLFSNTTGLGLTLVVFLIMPVS